MNKIIDLIKGKNREPAFYLIIFFLVFVPAIILRLHPVTSESFQHDAVVSQIAADRGILANALDKPGTFWKRRFHPPLLSYIITANNFIFGEGPFRSRLFSIIAGSIGCLMVSLAILKIMKGFQLKLPGSIFGGLMISFLPVHLYISRTSNWDAVYSTLVMISLISAAYYIHKRSSGILFIAGISACLATLTCEIGLITIPVFLYAFYVDTGRASLKALINDWLKLIALIIIMTAILWPAGIFKMDIARTIFFRFKDSAQQERNLPWYMFFVKLFRQDPSFTIFSLLACSAIAFRKSIIKGISGRLRKQARRSFRMLAPFGIYIITSFVILLNQRLVYLHHIADIFPPLIVIASCSTVLVAYAVKRTWRIIIISTTFLALALSIPTAFSSDSTVVGPQEHPGFLGIADFFTNRQGAKIYYYYGELMDYYLPGAEFQRSPPRKWTSQKIRAVQSADYDYIVTDYSMFSESYPDIKSITRALAPQYEMVHKINHRRTGEPVVWIYGKE